MLTEHLLCAMHRASPRGRAVRKPSKGPPAVAPLIEGATAGGSWLPEQPGTGATGGSWSPGWLEVGTLEVMCSFAFLH